MARSWTDPMLTANQTKIKVAHIQELRNAIDDIDNTITQGKADIASAITDMGQSASSSDTFATLASKIRAISSDATAAAGDILSGKTAYSGGNKITGSMTNRGAYNITPGATNKTIPAGYHNGSGVVYGDGDLVAGNIKSGVIIFGVAGTFTSDATAAAGDILSGKTAYVNGSKITGTMPNYTGTYTADGITYSTNTLKFSVPNAGYYADGAYVQYTDNDWVPENIKSGVNIFGKTGTHPNTTESSLEPSGGNNGDYWIHPDSKTVWKKINGVWEEIITTYSLPTLSADDRDSSKGYLGDGETIYILIENFSEFPSGTEFGVILGAGEPYQWHTSDLFLATSSTGSTYAWDSSGIIATFTVIARYYQNNRYYYSKTSINSRISTGGGGM